MTRHIDDIDLVLLPAPAPAFEAERMLVEWSIERILREIKTGAGESLRPLSSKLLGMYLYFLKEDVNKWRANQKLPGVLCLQNKS